MFLMSFMNKNKQNSERQKAAEMRFLKAIQGKDSLRVVDGTLYVDAEDVEEKMRALQKRAKYLLQR
ncbi:hypothetical protein [Stenotrophomonas acidaminiphila]|uniref:hypothetical protein n=1 Tax=Stenotrophomonas acidaminiphila TaxID=128780 RepID=UPI0028A83B02|nr:hypothetical protein [Stenotrophomonas acidaminiphila]